jgi:uncharacterized Ntn-hydrolase superfamily protein
MLRAEFGRVPATEAVMFESLLLSSLLSVLPVTTAGVAAPLAHTYSIVARDSVTGEMGVAVQSHYFSVGPVVPWAEAGVGAVATQSLVLVDYGPRGLELMRTGMTAPQALAALTAADPGVDGRQVAMIDTHGGVAAHTGKDCIPAAGMHQGAQYSVQANLMSNDRVWPAMAAAYEHASGDLGERMLQALEAGEKAGGDIRGRQSAAIVVVKGTASGRPWADRVLDLRVEDNPQPLVELRRLMRLRRAYNLEDEGDNFISDKRPEDAMKAYEAAMKLAPDIVELQFWAAVSMYTNNREREGLALFKQVFARERRWIELVPRLAKVGLFPDDAKKIAEVTAQGRPAGATRPGAR